MRELNRESYARHRARRRKGALRYKANWTEERRQQRLAYEREYRRTNFELLKEKKREYLARNREAVAARKRRYFEAHREQSLEWRRAYVRRNPDKQRARVQRYREAFPDKARAVKLARRAREHDACGTASAAQIRARLDYYGGRCWMCGDAANSFDHVIPLALGGSNWPANLRPACKKCNSRKGAGRDGPVPASGARLVVRR